MKQIEKADFPWKVSIDKRTESVRWGKYIYLSALSVILFLLLNHYLSPFYSISGSGFVIADAHSISVPFDATLTKINTFDGEQVQAGQFLIQFQSIELNKQRYQLSTELQKRTSDKKQLDQIQTFHNIIGDHDHASNDFIQQFEANLNKLESQGYISPLQRLMETQKTFQLLESFQLMTMKTEQLQDEIKQTNRLIHIAHEQLDELNKMYSGGYKFAPTNGTVAEMPYITGESIPAGQTILKIYDNNHYLYCYLDTRSWVTLKEGDSLWVKFPGSRPVKGHIESLFPVAEPLPAEFQPHFQPKLRYQKAKVVVDQSIIKKQPLLSTAKVYKMQL